MSSLSLRIVRNQKLFFRASASYLDRVIERCARMRPYFRKHPALIVLDGLLNAVVEKDPDVSLRKFVRYNAPIVLRCFMRKRK